MSEAEKTILEICKVFESGSRNFSSVPKVTFKQGEGFRPSLALGDIIWNLDELQCRHGICCLMKDIGK